VKLLLFALCAAFSVSVRASNVTLSSSHNGPAVFNSTNAVKVSNGSLIRVGTLLTPGDPNSFMEFGTSTVKNAGFGSNMTPGKVVGNVIPANDESTHGAFNGRAIYLWIYNAPTVATSIESGIFRTSSVFPSNDLTGIDDSVTVQSAVNVVDVISFSSATMPPRILPGDAIDSKHFILTGITVPPPADSDSDSIPDSHELSVGLNPSDPADALLDLDGDAVDNRLEYALGSDLRWAGSSGLPVQGKMQVSGVIHATFQFTRRRAPVTRVLVPELSTTLIPSGWQSGPSVFTTESIVYEEQTETVLLRDNQPLSTRPRLYFRLRLAP
jgi:hypothetical protein